VNKLAALAIMLSVCPPVLAQQETTKPAQDPKKIEAPAPPKPGKDRWLIKTASDAGAASITRRPEKTTVEKLRALPRPADYPLDTTPEKYQNERAGAVEKTIYTVEADVVEARLMPDGDYRVTIRGAKGETMVLEMPDPSPAFVSPNSPFAYAIKSAREQFDAKVKPERTTKPLNLHAKITGIGFFGRQYGKQAAAGNLIQLHPVVDFEWQDRPSTEFTAAKSTLAPRPPSPQR
jgi:hypothetical protein